MLWGYIFIELEKLDCSHNSITLIINLPNGLKYLDCSHNLITKLNELPDVMTMI